MATWGLETASPISVNRHHATLGMNGGLEQSMSVDRGRRRKFESPRGQMVFSMMFHDITLLYIQLVL